MITTGIVKEINLSKGKNINNVIRVELPIFETPSNNGPSTPFIVTATCSVLPGSYNLYNINDLVYIGFINNDLSKPVILGKIYQGTAEMEASLNSRGFLNISNLTVSNASYLSKDTTIGDISYDILERSLLKINNLESILNSAIMDVEIKKEDDNTNTLIFKKYNGEKISINLS